MLQLRHSCSTSFTSKIYLWFPPPPPFRCCVIRSPFFKLNVNKLQRKFTPSDWRRLWSHTSLCNSTPEGRRFWKMRRPIKQIHGKNNSKKKKKNVPAASFTVERVANKANPKLSFVRLRDAEHGFFRQLNKAHHSLQFLAYILRCPLGAVRGYGILISVFVRSRILTILN